MNNKSTFWCEKCAKKYYYDTSETHLVEIQRANLQKKIPHIEPETSKKTKAEYVERKSFKKCMTCGFLLKEVKNEKR
jgi:protein-arginine kinase activator protein McsA